MIKQSNKSLTIQMYEDWEKSGKNVGFGVYCYEQGKKQALQERLKELDEDILWLKKFKSFLFGSPYDSELVKQKLAHKISEKNKLKETS